MRFLLFIALLFPSAAGALTHRAEIDGVTLTIYAPDWTWQRQNVNVLAVAENNSGAPRSIHLELLPPPGKADHFKYNGPTSIALDMGVGETLRKAITDIYANDSFPRQVYGFSFAIRGPNNALTVPYPLRTIRGAAVASATWALYLPVVVALIWSALFALVLPRLSSPGAWRRTVPAALPGGDIAHE